MKKMILFNFFLPKFEGESKSSWFSRSSTFFFFWDLFPDYLKKLKANLLFSEVMFNFVEEIKSAATFY